MCGHTTSSACAMPDFILELARPADAQHLAEMSRDYIESGLEWRYRPESIRRFMLDLDTNVTVARCQAGEAAIGFAIMTYTDFEAHLVLLAVQPAWRRRGVATALVGWHLKSASVAGAQSLGVELRADNPAAKKLYESLGFHVIQRIENSYGGVVPALSMAKDLRVRQTDG